MSSLPTWALWIQVLSPVAGVLMTTTVAFVVAYVAWQQWKTARDKIAFDLFQLRYQLFIDLNEALGDWPTNGKNQPPPLTPELSTRVTLLFGAEVVGLLYLVGAAASKGDGELYKSFQSELSTILLSEMEMPLRRRK